MKSNMRTICTVLLLCPLSWTCSEAMAAVKVFLLGGQSNMQGMGGYAGWVSGAPADDPCPTFYSGPQTSVHFWDYGTPSNGVNVPAISGDEWVPLQPTFGYKSGEFGPEVSFGYAMHRLYPNDDIYLVKYAKGSTSLANEWRTDGEGTCYNWFKTRVNAALQNLEESNLSPEISGMIWMQGEGDAHTSAMGAAYEKNLKSFIAAVRSPAFSSYAAADMPFALGRINTYAWNYDGGTGAVAVRAAQEAVANQVSNVSWFNTDTLQWAYGGHFGTAGQIELGNLFADAIVAIPEPSSFRLVCTALLACAGYLFRKRCGLGG